MIENRDSSVGPGRYWPGLLLLGLVTWFMSSASYHSTFNPGAEFDGTGDFKFIYWGAHWLAGGETLYRFHPTGATYVYPPLLAVLLRPIGLLPIHQAAHIWFVVGTVCILLGVGLYASAARLTWRDAVPLSIMVILAFKFWPTVMSASLGTANFVLLFAFCAMFWADSRDRLTMLGICIALAALIKTWMLGLILYLILRRAWRAIVWCIVTYGLGMAALFTVVGWREWPMFARLNFGYLNQTIGTNIASQSIIGFARMYFRPNLIIHPLFESRPVYVLFIAVSFLIVLGGLVLLWRRGAVAPGYERRLRLGVTMLSVLLLSPFCQPEYFVLLLPLLWTLLAPAPGDEARAPRAAITAAVLVYLLFTRGGPYYLPMPVAYQSGAASLRVATQFGGAVALWCTTMYALRRGRGRVVRGEMPARFVLASPSKV